MGKKSKKHNKSDSVINGLYRVTWDKQTPKKFQKYMSGGSMKSFNREAVLKAMPFKDEFYVDLEKAESAKQKKMHKVMKEFKEGQLKSSSGKPVSSRAQAIAIGMSESGQSRKSEEFWVDLEKGGPGSGPKTYDIKPPQKKPKEKVAIPIGDKAPNKQYLIKVRSHFEGKSELDEVFDLVKAGEGSRGGKIIGHTKSGKAIYENKAGIENTQRKEYRQKHLKDIEQYEDAVRQKRLKEYSPEAKAKRLEESKTPKKQTSNPHAESLAREIFGKKSELDEVYDLVKAQKYNIPSEVGKTSSGKPIYQSSQKYLHGEYNGDDHKDAALHHAKLSHIAKKYGMYGADKHATESAKHWEAHLKSKPVDDTKEQKRPEEKSSPEKKAAPKKEAPQKQVAKKSALDEVYDLVK